MNRSDQPDPVSAFVAACISSHEDAQRMIEIEPSVIHSKILGDSILRFLVIEDYPEAVDRLLSFGAPVDSRDGDARTSLAQACSLGRFGCARVLLARGADPNSTDPNQVNVLHLAVSGQRHEIVKLLLENGARADYLGPIDETVFSGMASWFPVNREWLVKELESRGVTREGLFRDKRLYETHDTPEEAYGW